MEFATGNLKMVQKLTCSGPLAVNIHCLGPVWGDVIRRLVHHPSNMFTECLFQARLELDGQGDLEWARVLPMRALSRSWIREACTEQGTWPEGADRSPGPGSAPWVIL